MEPVLRAEEVSKRYGRVEALRGVSFQVPRGSLAGLVGPNGSGKTTLIRILVGIIRPSSGKALLFGEDPWRSSRARERLGYIPERPVLPSSVPVRELLRIAAMIRGSPRPLDAADEAIALAGLEGHEHKRFEELSAGLKQRAAIAHAMVHEPELLVADEPTANLDPLERMRILEILGDINRRRGLTVLFTSHVLAEVARLSDRVIVLLRGRVAFEGRPEDLVETARVVRVRTPDPERLAGGLAEEGFEVEREAFSVRVRLGSRGELPRLLRALSRGDLAQLVLGLDTVEAALEELLEGVRGG